MAIFILNLLNTKPICFDRNIKIYKIIKILKNIKIYIKWNIYYIKYNILKYIIYSDLCIYAYERIEF